MRTARLPAGTVTAGGILLGLEFAPHSPVPPSAILALGVLASVLLLGSRRIPGLGRGLGPFLLALTAAAAAGALRSDPPCAFPFRERVKVAGHVTAWEPTPYGPDARLCVHRFGDARMDPPRRLQVRGREGWGAPVGAWLRVAGRLEPERGATNPGARSWGEGGRLRPSAFDAVEWGPGTLPMLLRWRLDLAERVRTRLPGFPGRLGEAVLLGRGRALLPGEKESFRRSGASHLVAVSGLHVGLVVLLASMLLAPAPRALRVLGVVGASWLYAGLAAWTPSAVRAAALALGVSLSGLVRRQRPAPLGFALALPWLLWASPSFAGALGFRLSAAAVAGILVALDIAAPRRGGRIGLLLSPIVVSLGAQVGTLPLQLAAFGALAPLATLPNLVAIPLAGLFLPAALLAVLLPSPLASPATSAAALLARLLRTVLDLSAAHLPYVEHLPPPPSFVPILFALVPLLWFSLPTALRTHARIRGTGAGTIVLLVAALFLPRPVPAGPWIAFLDVGQGDAAVLRLSDGSTWLVDTGDDRGPGDGARRAVLPFLREQGIRSVSGLVISHRHRDHVGALASLLEGVEVEHVFDAGYGRRGGTSAVVDSLLAAHRLWPCLVAAGDTLHRSDRASLVALGPPRGDPLGPPPGHGLNDASLVIRVVDGAFRAVLAGDAEEAGESACVEGNDSLAAVILKIGHHGSSTSTHPAFLRAVSPRWAVISCGEGNRFGHPDPEVLARLEESGARILRTDRDGAIRIRVRGTRWEVRRHPPLSRWEPHPLSVVGDGDP